MLTRYTNRTNAVNILGILRIEQVFVATLYETKGSMLPDFWYFPHLLGFFTFFSLFLHFSRLFSLPIDKSTLLCYNMCILERRAK